MTTCPAKPCYCHLYNNESWAKLASKHGYFPCCVESQARFAFQIAVEEIEAVKQEK